MSTLATINQFLDSTRDLSVDKLNELIFAMDHTAEPQVSQGLAHSILGYMKLAEIKDQTASFAAALQSASKLKENHGWLFTEPAPVEVAAPVEKPVVEKVVKEKTEPKGEIAKRIFAGLADKSKANVIEVFQRELGTSKAGAQTYFYVCNGPTGAKRGRAATATPKVYVRKTPAGVPTKREQAASIYAAATDKSRDAIVAKFVSELGMTKSGATTYYYNVGGAHLRTAKK